MPHALLPDDDPIPAPARATVNHILRTNHGKRVAIIENEFGEVGVDDGLVVETKEEMVGPARKVDRSRSRFTPEVRHGLTKFALMYTYAHQTSASFTRCPCPRYFFPHRLQYSSSILRWYASSVGRHLFRR